jgi:hypothetical protein
MKPLSFRSFWRNAKRYEFHIVRPTDYSRVTTPVYLPLMIWTPGNSANRLISGLLPTAGFRVIHFTVIRLRLPGESGSLLSQAPWNGSLEADDDGLLTILARSSLLPELSEIGYRPEFQTKIFLIAGRDKAVYPVRKAARQVSGKAEI